MKLIRFARFALAAPLSAALAASAGTWSTQATLANNAYQGSIAIDANGNLVTVWYQNADAGGTLLEEIWGSSAAFGHAWGPAADISGGPGSASTGNPAVRISAAGNATAVYTNTSATASFVDKPLGQGWGSSATTGGVNNFFVSNDAGVEGLAWGTGGARATSSTIVAQRRSAGSAWGGVTTLASAPHLALDGDTIAPDGTMAVAWESFNSTCGSRTCTTSNWVLHVSTLAPGSQTWVDSGGIMGPDAKQHFAQLAADNQGNLGVIALQAGNVVSIVRHSGSWSSIVIVTSTSSFQFYTGTGRDNRIFYSDSAGHATLVGWGDIHLQTLAAIDGNLATNSWSSPSTISGGDQFPGYFDFAMSSSGAAIVFYPLPQQTSPTPWRAITRAGAGKPWNSPATAGTSYDAGGNPDGISINAAGQAAVVFHGYSSDNTYQILYTNTYHP
jgi:hypothetical protein